MAVYESGLTLLTQRDKVIAQTEHALSEGLQEKLETREQVVEYLSDYLTPQQMVQFGYL